MLAHQENAKILLLFVVFSTIFIIGYSIGKMDGLAKNPRSLRSSQIKLYAISEKKKSSLSSDEESNTKSWEQLHLQNKIIKPFDSWTISLKNNQYIFPSQITNLIDRNITLVIGIGSGRSGTLALQRFLNNQKSAIVKHEAYRCYGTEWEDVFSYKNHKKLSDRFAYIFKLNESSEENSPKIVGDVASWYLPYLPKIINAVEHFNYHNQLNNDNRQINLKIIALKRNRTDCINSWIKWLAQWNHFMWLPSELRNFTNFKHEKTPQFVECFPHYTWNFNDFKKLTVADGALQYYDDYYKSVDLVFEKYRIFDYLRAYDTYDALNDLEIKEEILSWIGVSRPFVLDVEDQQKAHATNLKKLREIKKKYKDQIE